jgi:protein-tyrosine phosphatase
VQAAGYMPIITHPERLDWVDEHYAVFKKMALSGIWMQITAGSLKGKFGKKAKYWGERMLNDGFVHMLATDAHNLGRRSPKLMEGFEAARYWVGDEEAQRLVKDRPKAVLDNISPDDVFPIPALIGAGLSNKGFKFKYDTIKRYFYFLNKP